MRRNRGMLQNILVPINTERYQTLNGQRVWCSLKDSNYHLEDNWRGFSVERNDDDDDNNKNNIFIYIYLQEILHLPVVFLQSPSCPRGCPRGDASREDAVGQQCFEVDRLNTREDEQLNNNNN